MSFYIVGTSVVHMMMNKTSTESQHRLVCLFVCLLVFRGVKLLWPSFLHDGASVECLLLWAIPFLCDSPDARPRCCKHRREKPHKQGQNMLSRTVWELENKWVTCLSRASSLLLFAFLLCFQFSKFSHLNLSSFILQSPRNASVTMQLFRRYTHKYEKNAGVRHLMSPLRLTLIVRRRGDFLCLKGEVSLEVKAKHRNGDFCILGQWEWIAQKIQNIKILHRAKLSMCNISFSLFLSA